MNNDMPEAIKIKYDMNQLPASLEVDCAAFRSLRWILTINADTHSALLDEPLMAMSATIDMIEDERVRGIFACIKEALSNAQDFIQNNEEVAVRDCDKLIMKYLSRT